MEKLSLATLVIKGVETLLNGLGKLKQRAQERDDKKLERLALEAENYALGLQTQAQRLAAENDQLRQQSTMKSDMIFDKTTYTYWNKDSAVETGMTDSSGYPLSRLTCRRLRLVWCQCG